MKAINIKKIVLVCTLLLTILVTLYRSNSFSCKTIINHSYRTYYEDNEVIISVPEEEKDKKEQEETKEQKESVEESKDTTSISITDELTKALKDDSKKTVSITIKEGTKLSKTDIDKIKDSGKKVTLNKYDDKNKLIYSWEMNGKTMYIYNDFKTDLIEESKNRNTMKKLNNNEDGIYITTKHTGKFPTGTKLKLYVGNKYKDGEYLAIYYFNLDTSELDTISEKTKVNNGYIKFRTENGSDYFIGISPTEDDIYSSETLNSTPIPIIILSAASFIVFGFIFFKRKENKEESVQMPTISKGDNKEEIEEKVEIEVRGEESEEQDDTQYRSF